MSEVIVLSDSDDSPPPKPRQTRKPPSLSPSSPPKTKPEPVQRELPVQVDNDLNSDADDDDLDFFDRSNNVPVEKPTIRNETYFPTSMLTSRKRSWSQSSAEESREPTPEKEPSPESFSEDDVKVIIPVKPKGTRSSKRNVKKRESNEPEYIAPPPEELDRLMQMEQELNTFDAMIAETSKAPDVFAGIATDEETTPVTATTDGEEKHEKLHCIPIPPNTPSNITMSLLYQEPSDPQASRKFKVSNKSDLENYKVAICKAFEIDPTDIVFVLHPVIGRNLEVIPLSVKLQTIKAVYEKGGRRGMTKLVVMNNETKERLDAMMKTAEEKVASASEDEAETQTRCNVFVKWMDDDKNVSTENLSFDLSKTVDFVKSRFSDWLQKQKSVKLGRFEFFLDGTALKSTLTLRQCIEQVYEEDEMEEVIQDGITLQVVKK